MAKRTKARKRAVELLYEAEARGVNVGSLLAERVETPTTQHPLQEYTVAIVEGLVEHWADVDELLSTYSHGWTLERMPDVDRAVLRVGAWEILHSEEVPDPVAISEAVALATTLSTDESPRFVNGLLARISEVKPTLV